MSPATRRAVILGGVLVLCTPYHLLSAKPSKSRPYAYLFPAELHALTEHLQRAGVQVSELREDIEVEVESHQISRSAVTAEGKAKMASRRKGGTPSPRGEATRTQSFRLRTEAHIETRRL